MLSRGPNAGSICDHSTGSDTDPRRNRTPSDPYVDSSGSYGISTDASIRRHPYRMSYEHSDGHTHRSVQKCARPRSLDKEPQRPSISRPRAAWLWKLLTCPISQHQPIRLAYQWTQKFNSPTNGLRLMLFRASFVQCVLSINRLAGITLSGKSTHHHPQCVPRQHDEIVHRVMRVI